MKYFKYFGLYLFGFISATLLCWYLYKIIIFQNDIHFKGMMLNIDNSILIHLKNEHYGEAINSLERKIELEKINLKADKMLQGESNILE
ncbi:MAG: hypothetical protein ISR83_01490 [Candidatus Marinimicrobia bacterium]|nr:hypothetical protein [Candidatus Neomarinimicrobiota bacterium]